MVVVVVGGGCGGAVVGGFVGGVVLGGAVASGAVRGGAVGVEPPGGRTAVATGPAGAVERGGGVAPPGGCVTSDVDDRGGGAPAATVVAVVTGAVVRPVGSRTAFDVVEPVGAGAAARRFVGVAAAAKLPTSATMVETLTTTVAARLRRATCPGRDRRAARARTRSVVGASAMTLHPFGARRPRPVGIGTRAPRSSVRLGRPLSAARAPAMWSRRRGRCRRSRGRCWTRPRDRGVPRSRCR